MMNDESKTKVIKRLRRTEGQVAGVCKMVEEDRYCIDILNQISAVRAALNAVSADILASHIESCLIGNKCISAHPIASGMSEAELMDEVRTVLSKLI